MNREVYVRLRVQERWTHSAGIKPCLDLTRFSGHITCRFQYLASIISTISVSSWWRPKRAAVTG
jgi:hypothetical protein